MATNNTELLLSRLTANLSDDDLIFASIASDLAVAITSKRLELGLSQKEFADFLGKTQSLISRWESADCNFTLKSLISLAQKLDLSLNVSLDPAQHTTPPVNSFDRPADNVINFPFYAVSSSSAWSHNNSEDEELLEM